MQAKKKATRKRAAKPAAEASVVAAAPPAANAVAESLRTTMIAVGVSDERIAELREQYAGLTIIDGDKSSYKIVSQAIGEISSLRKKVEERRLEKKREILQVGKGLDAEAARITGLLEEIEKPLTDERSRVLEEIKKRKERAERREAARISKIEEAMVSLHNRSLPNATLTAEEISKQIDVVRGYEITEDEFAEFCPRAAEVKATVLGSLNERWRRAQEEENAAAARAAEDARLKAERAELDRVQKEQAEQARLIREQQEELDREKAKRAAELEREQRAKLAEIRSEILIARGRGAKPLELAIKRVSAVEIQRDFFGDLFDEAVAAKSKALEELRAEHAKVIAKEKAAEEAEQARLAREQQEELDKVIAKANAAAAAEREAAEIEARKPELQKIREFVRSVEASAVSDIDVQNTDAIAVLSKFKRSVHTAAAAALSQLATLAGDHENTTEERN